MNPIPRAAALALLILPLGAAAPAPQAKRELRCGWIHNPTPANWWLDDRDGQWIIGTQGGEQAEGDIPDLSGKNWVRTNGDYGYGCGCMSVEVDRTEHRILRIHSVRQKPLSACRSDRTLPKPDRYD
ncbi:MAG: DUF4087 domain-containing protein [Sphingomonas sp.]